MKCFEKGKPFERMVSGNGLKLPIAKSKFTVNKYGQVLVKEQMNPLDDPQLKLYDKQTGKLQAYIKKPDEIEDE
jgi:hypothetical protein